MKTFALRIMQLLAILALGTAIYCLCYVFYDVNWQLTLDKDEQSSIMFIAGLGFISYAAALMSGPLIDKYFDAKYPNDKPPSESYWKGR